MVMGRDGQWYSGVGLWEMSNGTMVWDDGRWDDGRWDGGMMMGDGG